MLKPSKGDTVLHICAEFGRTELFLKFYEAGNSLTTLNKAMEMPLHVAAREGCYEIVKFYVAKSLKGDDSIEMDLPMIDGWTPFLYAAVNGYPSLVDLLGNPYVLETRSHRF